MENDIREEPDIIDKSTATESLHLPADAKKGLAVLLNAMYSYFSLHNMDFREMTECHEINHSESLVGAVHVVLADSPYDVRPVREDGHSVYDSFMADDMTDFLSLCEKVMKAGAQGQIFCTALQFGQWPQLQVTKKVDGDKLD